MAAVLLGSCFVGCGSKDSSDKDSSIAGKYEASKLVMGDETYEGTVMGIPIGTLMQFEFKSDGTVVYYEEGEAETEEDVTWKKDGSKLIVGPKEEGATDEYGDEIETIEFKIDGDNLTTEEDGMELTLVKVSEFTTVAAE